MEKFSTYTLLQCRPEFVTSLNEFDGFLKTTLDDLKAKKDTLKAQKKILGQNRKAKNYLSCQIYVLKKYLTRLDIFSVEIETRLDAILRKDQDNEVQDFDEKHEHQSTMHNESYLETGLHSMDDFKEAAIDCGDLEDASKSHRGSSSMSKNRYNESGESLHASVSSGSAYDDSLRCDKSSTFESITSLNDDTISEYMKSHNEVEIYKSNQKGNSINSNGSKIEEVNDSVSKSYGSLGIRNTSRNENVNNESTIDQDLVTILADMKKMKRRCKHVLDITDKYCVLNNETDLNLDLQQDQVADLNNSLSMSPITSPWSIRSSRTASPISEAASPTSNEFMSACEDEVDGSKGHATVVTNLQLPSSINDRGLVKMTLDSMGGHLGVLLKTYTRRHS